MSGNELRFPNVKEESEDPALVAARNSLKRKTPEPVVRAKRGMKTCWRCQEPVGKQNLTQKWIRRLNAQRYLCDDCIPFKDEVIPGRENEEYRPSPYNPPPVKITVKKPEKALIVKSDDTEKYQVKKIHSGEFIKFKECFKCDSTLFYVMKGGVVKCSECETEYNL
jgi:hypothetical protein